MGREEERRVLGSGDMQELLQEKEEASRQKEKKPWETERERY